MISVRVCFRTEPRTNSDDSGLYHCLISSETCCHTWDVSAVEVIKLCSGEAELLLNCDDEQQMKLFRPSALHIKLLSFFKSQNKTFFCFF